MPDYKLIPDTTRNGRRVENKRPDGLAREESKGQRKSPEVTEDITGTYRKPINKLDKVLFRGVGILKKPEVLQYDESRGDYVKSNQFKVVEIPNLEKLIDDKDIKDTLNSYADIYERMSSKLHTLRGKVDTNVLQETKYNFEKGSAIATELRSEYNMYSSSAGKINYKAYGLINKESNEIVSFALAYVDDEDPLTGKKKPPVLKISNAVSHPLSQLDVNGEIYKALYESDREFMENNKMLRLKRLGTVLVNGMLNYVAGDNDFNNIKFIETEAINPRSAKIAKNLGMKRVTS